MQSTHAQNSQCSFRSMLTRMGLPGAALFLVGFCLTVVASFAVAGETPSVSDSSASRSLAQGKTALGKGDLAKAGTSFEEAVNAARAGGDRGAFAEALVALAQVHSLSGQYRKALEFLGTALPEARGRGDRRLIAAISGAMGNAEIGLGNGDAARQHLQEGLDIAKEGGFSEEAATIMNNLGNLSMLKKDYGQASAAYGESATLAGKLGNQVLSASALVNGAAAAFRGGRLDETSTLLERGRERVLGTTDSSSKAHVLANVGLLFTDLSRRVPGKEKQMIEAAFASFSDALAVASAVGDRRTMSYAWGYLGQLYEETHQYPEALDLTQRAMFTAQQMNATEALYRWHWQTGRIMARLDRLDEAISSYRHSLRVLQGIREEMASCYASPESSYQKTAGTVSVQLVDLLLQRASKTKEGESSEAYLAEARDALEMLKVFELRDYFRDDCVDAARTTSKRLDDVGENTVVIYPILLPDRVELLVSFSGRLKRFTPSVTTDELTRETRELRRKLVKRTTWEFLPHAQKLYDWIIRPLEKDLEAMKGETLVFVPDGALRSIPLSALHDGKQFLVSRFAVVVTPSLNLTDPRPMKRDNPKILSLGLTQAVQGFPGLPYVSDELKAVQGIYVGDSLVDEKFRLANMEKELKKVPFSIIHIASHGQFGGDVDKTFLLAFDEKLTMNRFAEYVGLYRFRDEPLDLLTLSACETAAGDDRAALGLAGVAVRAGARSALATLWHVNDPASYELVSEFYRQLHASNGTRAAALQAAQQKLLGDMRYDHPGYWAPFLLINNWL